MNRLSHPHAVEHFAKNIISSWTHKKSNFIVVAPPLNPAQSLFRLLTNVELQIKVLGDDAKRLAIAKVGQSDFMKHSRLVAAVLKGWSLSSVIEVDQEYPLGALELALQSLHERDAIPVILVDRFHDAIKYLDGDFGIVLRDLEHDFFLKTVVSIPVSLEELRFRPGRETEASPFLQSDWGTGHLERVLKGYSESELLYLFKDKKYGEEMAKFLFRATAGLPELVDRVINHVERQNLNSFQLYLRAQSLELCQPLLNYIDAKGEDLYQRLVAELVNDPNAQIDGITLKQHSWSEILLDGSNCFSCWMLGWAALDNMTYQRNPAFIAMLAAHVQNRRFKEAASLLSASPGGTRLDGEVWGALSLILKFIRSINVNNEVWESGREIISEFRGLSDSSENPHIVEVAKAILKWESLVDLVFSYSQERKLTKDLRFEDFVCQQKSQTAFIAFLQLHQLRIDRAEAYDEPLTAMKLIIELPESLIQVYCYYKYGVEFWCARGIDESTRGRINNLFGIDFRPPSKGQRLEFQSLLWLSYVSSESHKAEDRLFQNTSEIIALEKKYKERTLQVHSTSFGSLKDWNSYRQEYISLRDRVLNSFGQHSCVEFLPDLTALFCKLLSTLGDRERNNGRP